jgi:hypothetical protein
MPVNVLLDFTIFQALVRAVPLVLFSTLFLLLAPPSVIQIKVGQ